MAIRGTLTPLVHTLLALALFHCGARNRGLAWAFTVTHAVMLALSAASVAHAYRGVRWPRGEPWRFPPGLFTYAIPLWLSEMVNAIGLRLDTLVLAALTDPATVGVWGIVRQFADALRQIRRAYDPIVTALSARIAAAHDRVRLTAAFSYASQMVSLTQLPVFALFLCGLWRVVRNRLASRCAEAAAPRSHG